MTGDTFNLSGKNVVGVVRDNATVNIHNGGGSELAAALAEVVAQIRELRPAVADDAGDVLDEAVPILEKAGPTATPQVGRALNRSKDVALASGRIGAALLDAANNALQLLGLL